MGIKNSFEVGLFTELLKRSNGENVFISPLSISVALNMVLNGATGQAEEEMRQVLGWDKRNQVEINSVNKELINRLRDYISIANSLFSKEEVSKNYKSQIQKYYEAVAYIGRLDETDINNWVSAKTRGNIKSIIDGGLDPMTVLAILNAVYFKGEWDNRFDRNLTCESNFYLSNGDVKRLPMMHQSSEYQYFEDDLLQAIMLPYNGPLAAAILLPRPGCGKYLIERLNAEKWNDWMNRLESTRYNRKKGMIILPRFNCEYSIDLGEVLQALGMNAMFNARQSSFEKIAPNLYVGTVKHKAGLKVNEEGTEAYAATYVGMLRMCGGSVERPFEMRVDRPCIFAICDTVTQKIMFIGKIENPE